MASGIPPEVIERIRSQADIVQVISEYLTLKKAGANYKALCPFHREKTPSFMVNPARQIFHCFGCGAGGNVFGFLMRQEGFTFPEAVRFLAAKMGIQVKEYRVSPGQREMREQLFDLYEFATSFYHRCLTQSPRAENARNYLQKRELGDEVVKKFSLGWAPDGWDSLLSAATKKGFSNDVLLRAGLTKKSAEGRLYDAFRNRIMFPIWGISGKVIAFGGRALGEDQPKYINSPETPIYQKGQILYNLHRAKKNVADDNAVIVVEGYTDVIRLVMGGVENVVASSGTAFTQAQARLIKRYANDVTLVFDPDSAGEAAAQRGIEVLLAEDLGIKVALLPVGKDPDAFVREQGPDAFIKAVGGAKNFIEFHTEKAAATAGASQLESKIATANMLASLVGKIPNPIRREEYLRLVGSRLGIKPETLRQASQKGGSADRIEEEARHAHSKLGRLEKEYMWLIRLLVKQPEYIGAVREMLDMKAIQSDPLRQLFDAIFGFEGGSIEETSLLGRVQSEEGQQILSEIMFENIVRDDPMYSLDWWREHSKRRQEEERFSELSKEIAEAERNGDIKRLNKLLEEKRERKRQLAEIKKIILAVSVDSAAESILG
jgi:DNA primase